MDYDTFLRRVQEVAELPTRDDAERITRVVLNTLSERLHHTDRSALASQLPSALRALMEEHTDTDRYDLPEFYRRVALRADTSLADGEACARAVGSVLREAVTAGQIEEMLATLPEDYATLFGAS
jgi:uncharacterized protein (DUF2267 family)